MDKLKGGRGNVIEVRNLVKKYGNHLAVNNLSFTVNKGEILGFLGPNGAGKSTTMNMITGYISATEGSVIINGYDLFEEPEEAKKSIGYLPEQPPLYLDMTVKEYMNFVADLKKLPKKDRKDAIHHAMKKTGILDMEERLIKHLSKGYRQRVGLAQAILGDPDLIILDEPTVGLDPMQIIEIRDLIQKLSKEHAVILSSHILAEISAICDKVMIINQGKLVVSDTPDNLSNHIKGSNSVQLLIKGDKATIQSGLSKIHNIRKVEYKLEGDLLNINVTCDSDVDVREQIFYTMAELKCPILSMSSSKMSLEDIFLKVTKASNNKVVRKKTIRNRDITNRTKETKEEK